MAASRAQRHGMNRPQKITAFIVAIVSVIALGGFLFYHYGPPSNSKQNLSTTPECLVRHHAFCTGVALATANYASVKTFTDQTGVKPALVEYYQRFGKPFSSSVATQMAKVTSRPFIQINPHGVSIADIANGQWDRYITKYADDVKAFELPVILCFGHEVNGTWSSWSHAPPATFIAAWQHIHDIFVREGALNVLWAWDISHGQRPPQQWWPGAKYVDLVGIDGYLRTGDTFGKIFRKTIKVVHGFAPGIPIVLTETAVQPGPDAVAMVNELFTKAKAYDLRGLVWFNENKKEDWQLVPHTPILAAFINNVSLSKTSQ